MWQADEPPQISNNRPDSWADIQRRLDRLHVGAYCAMRFDGHSRERVTRELGVAADEIEHAVRRGAEIYGHDVEDALSWVGLPEVEAKRRRERRRAFQPVHRIARPEFGDDRLSGFLTPPRRQAQ